MNPAVVFLCYFSGVALLYCSAYSSFLNLRMMNAQLLDVVQVCDATGVAFCSSARHKK